MRIVHQEALGECGLATLAIVLDLTLERVRSDAIDAGRDVTTEGLTDDDLVGYLRHHGLTNARAQLGWDGKQPAILTVPSLNRRGLLHFVVWDGESYLDPSPGPLRYPDDGYEIGGRKVHWASAIVWSDPEESIDGSQDSGTENLGGDSKSLGFDLHDDYRDHYLRGALHLLDEYKNARLDGDTLREMREVLKRYRATAIADDRYRGFGPPVLDVEVSESDPTRVVVVQRGNIS